MGQPGAELSAGQLSDSLKLRPFSTLPRGLPPPFQAFGKYHCCILSLLPLIRISFRESLFSVSEEP